MKQSRAVKREERYALLKAYGETQTTDYLYKSEVRKLEERGYLIKQISVHPVRKSLLLCIVVFPKQN